MGHHLRLVFAKLTEVKALISPRQSQTFVWQARKLMRVHWPVFEAESMEHLWVESILVGNFEQLVEPWSLKRAASFQPECITLLEPRINFAMRIKNEGDQAQMVKVTPMGVEVAREDD